MPKFVQLYEEIITEPQTVVLLFHTSLISVDLVRYEVFRDQIAISGKDGIKFCV